MFTWKLSFLLGRREKGGPLFSSLLRNSLSCYFLSAFEFALHPIPLIGAGWKDGEHNQCTPRGHTPCTCSFLPIKTGHKGAKCEKETSQFSLLLTISSASGMFLHCWLCHMISCRTPSPTRIFPRLATQHPPAYYLTVQKPVFFFVELFTVLKNPPREIEGESSPMKLASSTNFCIRRK